MTHDDLRFYSYVFVRRLPLMSAICVVVGVAGLAYVLSLPPVYEATGTILVKSPELSATLASTGDSTGALPRLQVIQQELLTYDSLLALAKRHPLYATADMVSPDGIVADLRSRISQGPVFFGGNESALGFSITFKAARPDLAAEVANDLIGGLLERDLNDRSSRATESVSFFRDEVARLSEDLAAIEARVKAYKTEHIQALPDTLEYRRLMQTNLRDRLLELDREESSLQSRRATYLQYYRGSDPSVTGVSLPPERRQLEDLKQALVSQSMQFSEESLAIQSLKSQIATAEAKLGSMPADAPESEDTSSRDMQLADMDARLKAIAQERQSLQRNDAELTSSISATPANEAALTALEREYDEARSLYTAAATRLADASTGERIEAGLKGERLILLESARPPERPTGPKRMLLLFGVIAAAVAAALGTAVLLELLNNKVRRAADIERAFGIEVLASIPSIPSGTRKHFRLPGMLRRLKLPGLPQRFRSGLPLHWIGTVRR